MPKTKEEIPFSAKDFESMIGKDFLVLLMYGDSLSDIKKTKGRQRADIVSGIVYEIMPDAMHPKEFYGVGDVKNVTKGGKTHKPDDDMPRYRLNLEKVGILDGGLVELSGKTSWYNMACAMCNSGCVEGPLAGTLKEYLTVKVNPWNNKYKVGTTKLSC